jgi:hypothetical protein
MWRGIRRCRSALSRCRRNWSPLFYSSDLASGANPIQASNLSRVMPRHSRFPTGERTGSLRTQSARHRVNHGTICGRSCANWGHYRPLCACVDRSFVNRNSSRRRPEKICTPADLALVPAGMCEVDWHNPPQRLLVLWLTGEVEFETSDGSPPTPRRERGAGGGHHRQGTYFPSSAGGPTGGARGFRVVLKSKRDRVRSIAPSPPLWTRAPFVRQNPTFRDGHHNGSRLRADARGRDGGVREKLAGGRGMIEVARVRITEAGRKALAEMTR